VIFGHLLVHGDGVAVRGAELSAGEPDGDAVVVVAEAARMMQPLMGVMTSRCFSSGLSERENS
jgi:hypothetical protein